MPGVFYPQCIALIKVIFDDQTATPDPTPIEIMVTPRSASVHSNGYNEADTFELDFDAAAFPCSPELIRSMAVGIYLFETPDLTYDLSNYKGSDDDLAIVGLVDHASYHAGADGLSFKVSGRDYTALMLDKAWPAEKKFPVGKDLTAVIQDLVNEASIRDKSKPPVLQVIAVDGQIDNQIGGTNAKQKAAITAGKYSISKKGKLKIPVSGKGFAKSNKKGIPQPGGSNYWDAIYRACLFHGLIAYVAGTEVRITTPQTLTEATAKRLRSVAFGRDLSYIDIERKLSKDAVPQVRIVSYDPVKRVQIQATFPKNPAQKTTAIQTKKDEIRILTVPGITTESQLLKIAELYYQNLARSEATIKFGTKDLKDLYGNSLIRLRAGDPVAIGFDALTVGDFKNLSRAQREAKLKALRYENRVARTIADNFDRIEQFQQPFYTKSVTFNWSISDGLGIDVEGVNFINVPRDDARTT